MPLNKETKPIDIIYVQKNLKKIQKNVHMNI